MKTKYFFITLFVGVLFASCENYHGWVNLSDEKLEVYAPYSLDQTLSFYNSEKDSIINFQVKENRIFREQEKNPMSKSYGVDHIFLSVKIVDEIEKFSILYAIGIRNYEQNSWECEDDRILSATAYFEKDIYRYKTQIISYKEGDIALKDVKNALYNEYYLENNSNDNYAIIAKNRGLVEFFVDNELWTLVE